MNDFDHIDPRQRAMIATLLRITHSRGKDRRASYAAVMFAAETRIGRAASVQAVEDLFAIEDYCEHRLRTDYPEAMWSGIDIA